MFRRIFLCSAFLFTAVIALQAADPAPARDPNKILDDLLKGNDRFITGTSVHPNSDRDRRIETAKDGEKPVAAVLGCSDPRVPVEQIFDAGIGDLFVVRVAGNIAEKSQVASLEYSVVGCGAPVIIVLGHTKCETVIAAVKNDSSSMPMKTIINNIEPVVEKVRKENSKIAEDELAAKAITENVWQSIDDIFKRSAAVRSLVNTGRLKVVGAIYDIETGKVHLLGVHLRQDFLLKKYSQKTGTRRAAEKK